MIDVFAFGRRFPSLAAAWREYSKDLGLSYDVVRRRFETRRGWTVEEVLTKPKQVSYPRPTAPKTKKCQNGNVIIWFPPARVVLRLDKAMNDESQLDARVAARISHFEMAMREE